MRARTEGRRVGWALLALALVACSNHDLTWERTGPDLPGSDDAEDVLLLAGDDAGELARFNAYFAGHVTDPSNTRQLKHFRDAYARVEAAYVNEVSDADLIAAALKGVQDQEAADGSLSAATFVETALDALTASLDPHSAYLNPEELREAEMATSGEFGGLGIQVSQENKRIKVIAPIEDTPAARAGILAGDFITAVDGRAVSEMSLTEAVRSMRGEPGSNVRLTILREGGKGTGGERVGNRTFEVSLTRAVIEVKPVRWDVFGDVGYIRVVGFSEKTSDGVEAAVEDIRARLGDRARGLVLDMRNNPGGLFDQSLRVADAFLESGVIVSVRGRHLEEGKTFRARRGDIAEGLPMVVLINGGSASASEIVASALQDQGRATVMGVPSFGKGSVQTVMRLPVEGALKLTTALYYAPSGSTIQARGVGPDIVLTGTEEPASAMKEADLEHAFKGSQSNRPALAEIAVSSCPPAGERQDRELGCALSLLEAGSIDRFVANRLAARAG